LLPSKLCKRTFCRIGKLHITSKPCHCALQGAPRRPFIGFPPPGMYMGYGMDVGPYRGRGRGPMPMQPGRFAQPAYGYGYGYGYFPPPFAQPFPGRMPQGVQMGGGRGFIGERRPPPGTPGVSSGLQVSYCHHCTLAAHAILHWTGLSFQIINAEMCGCTQPLRNRQLHRLLLTLCSFMQSFRHGFIWEVKPCQPSCILRY